MNIKKITNPLSLLLIFGILITACQSSENRQEGVETASQEATTYNEQYRPQFHFSPAKNWMNDPNGLVYHDGEYHLFYQYNPFGDTWGHMSWGHAVSDDLVHWEHLPVALEEENNVMIFSGSAVVDHNNTSGFGSADNPPMVAIYTGHHTDQELQDQRIAYSTDNGRSWTKYEGNPVLDEEMANFRDPKVIWHEGSQQWVMVVALPTEYKVRFYGSENLKEWNLLSEFGPSGATGGIWECPDLFELAVDGDSDQSKWVLQVDLNPGGPFGGSGSQYFVGEFDGKTFAQDPDTEGETRWVDYGKDFYAVQSYDNIPENNGRRIWISWMNNWQYAEQIPTSPWRSAMTIPRSLSLQTFDDGIHLVHQPVQELQQLRGEHHQFEQQEISGASDLLAEVSSNGNQLEVIASFSVDEADTVGFKVAQGTSEETVVAYDAVNGYLFVDRTNSGQTDFNENFAGVHKAPLKQVEGEVKLHIFIDRSSVEVFGNDGRVVITDRIFPSDGSDGISLFTTGGSAELQSLDIWQLNSSWN
ncbi:glycoside hydrolase family 32 protein [Aliifodinibius sp. S!AR15-10]|uniref:glycoside hydrolase family 32 protein n=1 Tax=Aliifodinibius sp. S!AR15-10 TaxID=2950437 RepID=UPI002857FF59|nr:glycoside hydrolase family 32 protein [Aliifodinibius sp. S!AR15-10]MDR8393409.1 glycoside hydrolase family 32 protein [Aliifodinibius sp. S!AR15-10]